MNLLEIVERLEVYTNIPRLTFQFETDEYIYMADTMNHVNYIFKNIGLIELGKQKLKEYRDDPETIRNIKEHNKHYEEMIGKSLETLEENYQKHQITLSKLSMYEENEDEQRC